MASVLDPPEYIESAMPAESESPSGSHSAQGISKTVWLGRGLLLLGFALLVGIGWFLLHDHLSLEAFAQQERRLEQQGHAHPILVLVIAFGLYVLVTALSIPVAAALTITIGWAFKLVYGPVWGFLIGLVLVSFASTAGASIAFLLSRYVFRSSFQQRFQKQLQKFNKALEEEGAFYLFSLRLIPAVPFQVINFGMGLTTIRLRTYWWVTQLGMLPGTAVFLYAGWAVTSLQTLVKEQGGIPDLLTPKIWFAFLLLGLFPLVVKKGMAYWKRIQKRSGSETGASGK